MFANKCYRRFISSYKKKRKFRIIGFCFFTNNYFYLPDTQQRLKRVTLTFALSDAREYPCSQVPSCEKKS